MAARFIDDTTKVTAANLNSLDRGGNVWQNAAGGLKIDISAFRWAKMSAWATNDYAGATNQSVTASQTNYVYVDTSNVLQVNTSGFPAGAHIPLATVVTDTSNITLITDKRFAAWIP